MCNGFQLFEAGSPAKVCDQQPLAAGIISLPHKFLPSELLQRQ